MNLSKEIRVLLGITLMEIVSFLVIILLLVMIVIIPSFWNTNEFRQYLEYMSQNPSGIFKDLAAVKTEVNNSKLAGDASIFIFWSVVGLLGYTLMSQISKMVSSGIKFYENLNDLRQNRSNIVNEAVRTTIIRFIAIGLLIGWAYIAREFIVGFVIVSLSAITRFTVESFLFSMLSLVLLGVWLHVLVSLLRLFFMKRRLFIMRYHSINDM